MHWQLGANLMQGGNPIIEINLMAGLEASLMVDKTLNDFVET